MAQVTDKTIVTLDYTLTDPDGNMLDTGEKPLIYLHGGYDGIFLPIETVLQGKMIGESISVKMQPDQAFGEYDTNLVQLEPVENLPQPLTVGMQIEGCTEEESGEHSAFFTVTDIADGIAVLDGNHPLAGMALVFTGTVTALRPARDEELAAGRPL